MNNLAQPYKKVNITPQSNPFSHAYKPILTITSFSKTSRLTYTGTRASASKGGVRGCIYGSSRKSENNFRIMWEDYAEEICKYWIYTSYPLDYPKNGQICQRHCKELLRRLKRIGVNDYIWRIEFQDRGAVHFNIFVPQYVDPAWLSRNWYEIVKSGDPKHLLAGTSIKAVKDKSQSLSYLLSYTKKETQKLVPADFESVGRFWGCSRKLSPSSVLTLYFDDDFQMHRWLRPIKKAYQKACVRHWKRNDGKSYKFKPKRRQGFLAWGASNVIQTIIERSNNEQSKGERENITRKETTARSRCVSEDVRKVFRINNGRFYKPERI